MGEQEHLANRIGEKLRPLQGNLEKRAIDLITCDCGNLGVRWRAVRGRANEVHHLSDGESAEIAGRVERRVY